MPTFPEEESRTSSSGKYNISIGSRLPNVHHLTSTGLVDIGFILFDKVYKEKGQGWKMVYKKGKNTVSYDGTNWMLNDTIKIMFFEDLNDLK